MKPWEEDCVQLGFLSCRPPSPESTPQARGGGGVFPWRRSRESATTVRLASVAWRLSGVSGSQLPHGWYRLQDRPSFVSGNNASDDLNAIGSGRHPREGPGNAQDQRHSERGSQDPCPGSSCFFHVTPTPDWQVPEVRMTVRVQADGRLVIRVGDHEHVTHFHRPLTARDCVQRVLAKLAWLGSVPLCPGLAGVSSRRSGGTGNTRMNGRSPQCRLFLLPEETTACRHCVAETQSGGHTPIPTQRVVPYREVDPESLANAGPQTLEDRLEKRANERVSVRDESNQQVDKLLEAECVDGREDRRGQVRSPKGTLTEYESQEPSKVKTLPPGGKAPKTATADHALTVSYTVNPARIDAQLPTQSGKKAARRFDQKSASFGKLGSYRKPPRHSWIQTNMANRKWLSEIESEDKSFEGDSTDADKSIDVVGNSFDDTEFINAATRGGQAEDTEKNSNVKDRAEAGAKDGQYNKYVRQEFFQWRREDQPLAVTAAASKMIAFKRGDHVTSEDKNSFYATASESSTADHVSGHGQKTRPSSIEDKDARAQPEAGVPTLPKREPLQTVPFSAVTSTDLPYSRTAL